MMNILALEAYYDGSHRAFLDGWSQHSRHNWTLMTLPGYKWKWRMRHSAITFAQEILSPPHIDRNWDCLFYSDMLNVAEFKGLLPSSLACLPVVVYFHENQLTYPVRQEHERDYHFAMTNISSALAAEAVWFNSHYHQDTFLACAEDFLRRMPDYQPLDCIETIRAKSVVHPPGITTSVLPNTKEKGPTTLLWAARWEHDKNPDDFFTAIARLIQQDKAFRLNVIGQHFEHTPEIFAHARQQYAPYIHHWGFQPGREAYRQCLLESDIVISTALHEFFGIGIVEAMAAGAYPVVPRRLAYPEVLGLDTLPGTEQFFYDGTVDSLTNRLSALIDSHQQDRLWQDAPDFQQITAPFTWTHRASAMDSALSALCK